MLLMNQQKIGVNIQKYRKQLGLTQVEVAEIADLSDRAFADIERGTSNMRVDTLLKICAALRVTPNDLLTEDAPDVIEQETEILTRLKDCSEEEKRTAYSLLAVYLDSLK